MDVTGPLFKCYGSKWTASKRMPPPKHDILIEPFAGGAGYALRHADKRVVLAERDPHVRDLWTWLIGDATETLIREIPTSVPEGTDIRTLALDWGQRLLVKHWQRTNNVGDCWTISPWGNKPGQWTANTRARVASEVGAVKRWRILPCAAEAFRQMGQDKATWFIDPPYEFNYSYKQPPIDYEKLGRLVQRLPGQKIACEARGKDGQVPTWLPFEPFERRITSRRAAADPYSDEMIWTDG